MNELKRAIWNGWLDADMNLRYFGYLARRFSSRDKWLKVFVAITTSATVASWQLWNETAGFLKFSVVWQVVGGASAVVAIALPIMHLGNLIRVAADLHAQWVSIEIKYELLWHRRGDLTKAALHAEYSRIKKLENDMAAPETIMPRKEKLLKKCQQEVVRSRGLNLTQGGSHG